MLRNRRIPGLFLAALLIGCAALQAMPLSETNRGFLDGPAGFLATDAERKEWKDVKADTDAERFIALFWARRDPTPGNARNEFKIEFDKRVEAAAKLKEIGGIKGDRANVFVLLGMPAATYMQQKDEFQNKMDTSSLEPAILAQYSTGHAAIWRYHGKDKLPAGYPDDDLTVVFITEEGRGENQLDRKPRVLQALELAKKAAIKSPDLKEVPSWPVENASLAPAAVPAPAAPAAVTMPPVAAIPEPFAGAAANAFAAEPAGSAEKAALFFHNASTIAGRPFTSALLVAKKDAVPAGAPVKLFGEVRDANGVPVARFALDGEKAAPVESNGELTFGYSVLLTPGSYRVAMGISSVDGSVMHLVKTAPVVVPDLKSGAMIPSSLILTKSILTLEKAQLEEQAFCFGGVRVMPTAFLTYGAADSLWYFFTITNPSVDPESKKPAIQTIFSIKEKGNDKPRLRTPPSDATLTAISDGRYAIGSEIPLSAIPFFCDGTWRVEIDVFDKLAKDAEGKPKLVKEKIGADFEFKGKVCAAAPVEKPKSKKK